MNEPFVYLFLGISKDVIKDSDLGDSFELFLDILFVLLSLKELVLELL